MEARREIKEDKLITAWFTGLDYVRAHSRELIYGAIGIVVLIAAVFWYNRHTASQEQEAALLFVHSKVAYDAQNYDAAVDSLVKSTASGLGPLVTLALNPTAGAGSCGS